MYLVKNTFCLFFSTYMYNRARSGDTIYTVSRWLMDGHSNFTKQIFFFGGGGGGVSFDFLN